MQPKIYFFTGHDHGVVSSDLEELARVYAMRVWWLNPRNRIIVADTTHFAPALVKICREMNIPYQVFGTSPVSKKRLDDPGYTRLVPPTKGDAKRWLDSALALRCDHIILLSRKSARLQFQHIWQLSDKHGIRMTWRKNDMRVVSK